VGRRQEQNRCCHDEQQSAHERSLSRPWTSEGAVRVMVERASVSAGRT
jgi:hypothetical protein